MTSKNTSSNLFSSTILKWDTDFFGFSTKKHTILRRVTEADFEIIKDSLKGSIINFIYCDSEYNDSAILANGCGCNLVDIAVRLKLSEMLNCPKNLQSIKIDKLTSLLISDILKISSNAFTKSRFYRDSNISSTKANQLYQSWIENSITDENKRVIKLDNKGFILFKEYAIERKIEIELLAVAENFRGSGLGYLLICHLIDYIKQNYPCYEVFVETQIDNIAAMNMYIKAGFRITSETYIYHFWNL